MKRMNMILCVTFSMLLIFIPLYWKYHQAVNVAPNDTQLLKLEETIIPGKIYDRNGLLIAEGVDLGGTFSYIDNEIIRESFSNLFSLTLTQTGISPFYLRNVLAPDIYGYRTNRLTIESFFDTQLKGSDVTLTMDMTLNGKIYEILKAGSYSAGVCVYNYKTGEVLAMVSTPSYDLANETTWPLQNGKISTTINDYAGMNRVVQECYPPCSMMKPILYSIILEQRPDLASFTHECIGTTEVNGITITDHYPHGTMDLANAIAQSCNPFAVQIGEVLTAEQFQTGLDAFGFSEGLNSKYLTYYKGNVDMTTTANKVFAMLGQGGTTKMSVLQLTKCYGAFFNQGIMMEPHVTKEGNKQKGTQVVSVETAQAILEGLKLTTVNGTGGHMNMSSYGYVTAGKTGTGDLEGNNTIWSTGGFVDETMPYMVTVCLNGRNSGDTGGDICAPIAKQILELLLEAYKE